MNASEDSEEHMMQCVVCGEWFDRRSLDEVMKHTGDHKERADIPYTGSKRVK